MNNVVNLRETQQTSKSNINSQKVNFKDIDKSGHFFPAIVTGVLLSRYSEIRGAIVRTAKITTILKRPVNKLFTVKNTNGTNQAVKARRQKLRREAAVIGELKMKYEC